ncbi:nucleotide sugar dehydrogenase [Pelagibacterales bacterium SAG-MED43]|nr:nucleotide sugar dehydrogenase [Pelagibacterales bacterium SAG-MED43]
MKKIFPCIIGLGYVGLPLFVSLKKKFQMIGYDISKTRTKELKKYIDRNKEFTRKDLKLENKSLITSDHVDIKDSNFYIVTVPTPIKKNKYPDLNYIKSAFKIISKYIKNNDIVFLESTVYPGTTLKICKNIIKKKNKNINFFIGYSSERVNPGDKIHNIKNIPKVVSIDANNKIVSLVKKVYQNVSKKIVFTKKINEAELSKLIENTQRDLNIGLMNEIMILCEKANLDFNEVIRLAKTKWNFLNFKPGLVGGHCLPVDPYYLSYYAKKLKYNTEITLAARKTNNSMEQFVLKKIILKLKKLRNFKKRKITVMGLTYKSNVPDYRNSLAVNIYYKLKRMNKNIKAYDPIIEDSFIKKNNINTNFKEIMKSEIFIILVKHDQIGEMVRAAKKNKKVIIDPLSLI